MRNKLYIGLLLLMAIPSSGQNRFILEDASKPRFELTDKVWPQIVGDASVCLWNDDKLSAFTITIDDNYEQDIPFWNQLQKKYGFTCTWFVITEAKKQYNVKNWSLFNELANSGNAIQGHDDRNWYEDKTKGIDYPSLEAYHKRLNRTKEKIEKNIEGQKCLTYAYPWGEGNVDEAAKHFIASRGVIGLLNPADKIDFKQVRSISHPHIYLNDSTRNHYILPLLNKVSKLEGKNYFRGWGSIHFHEVSSAKDQQTTDEFFSYLKDKENELWIATFPEVAKYAQEYATHSLIVDSISQTKISLVLKDGMNNVIFDQPLTIKVRLANNWVSLSAMQNGHKVDSKIITYNHSKYALVKAVPDGGQIELVGTIDSTIPENDIAARFEMTTIKDEYYIPQTISQEARNILEKRKRKGRFGAMLPKPNAPIEEWTSYQKKFEDRVLEALGPIKKHYRPEIDTVSIGGIRALDVKPNGYEKNDKVIVFVHGGGYVVLSPDATLASMLPLAEVSGLKIMAIDYTLAPKGDFESMTDEVIQFYKGLLQEYRPENIAIYGDSAGGGLAAGSILKMRDLGLPLPSSLVLWSPWLDIDDIGDTRHTLADNDPSLLYPNYLEHAALAYAPKSEFKNPYVSPLYGDYSKDFPPTLLQVGSKEIFLSDAIRMYRNLDDNEIEVKLDVYEGLWHVWQGYYLLPESKKAVLNTKKFMFNHFSQ